MLLEILIITMFYNALFVYSHGNLKDKLLKSALVQEGPINDKLGQFSSCYENLGCISTTDEWFHKTYRPRNLEPLDRITINTQFILMNVDDESGKTLKCDTLSFKNGRVSLGDYNINDKLMILVHDFTSNGYTGWVKHTAAAYLNRGSTNIVSVDWESGAEPPFEQAIANARVVALEIIAFINIARNSKKRDKRRDSFRVHIIGHGVGAHIAGYVAASTSIDRITGLDPTGPYFEGMPPIVRLDRGDANFVEVLHTDAFNKRSQGTMQKFGHFDFYANEGKLQPYCNESSEFPSFTKVDREMLKEGSILPACSHKRSFKYFIEAIEHSKCEFTGFKCDCYEHFLEGKCLQCKSGDVKNLSCATFGLDKPGEADGNYSFFFKTDGKFPYCLNPYLVKISLQSTPTASRTVTGNFELILLDDNGFVVNTKPTNEGSYATYEVGQSFSLIYYGSLPAICNVVEARLKWKQKPSVWCLGLCHKSVYVNLINITLLSLYNRCNSSQNQLCPIDEKSAIESGNYAVFKKCHQGAISTTTYKIPGTHVNNNKKTNPSSTPKSEQVDYVNKTKPITSEGTTESVNVNNKNPISSNSRIEDKEMAHVGNQKTVVSNNTVEGNKTYYENNNNKKISETTAEDEDLVNKRPISSNVGIEDKEMAHVGNQKTVVSNNTAEGNKTYYENNNNKTISETTAEDEDLVNKRPTISDTKEGKTNFYVQSSKGGSDSRAEINEAAYKQNKKTTISDTTTNIERTVYRNNHKSTSSFVKETSQEVYGNNKVAAISGISTTQSDATVIVNNKESKISDSTTNIEGTVYQNNQKSTSSYIQAGSEEMVYGNSKHAAISGISTTQSGAVVFLNNTELKISDSTTNIERTVYQNNQKSTSSYIQAGNEGTLYGYSMPAVVSGISTTQSDATVSVNNKESKISDSTTNIEGTVYQNKLKLTSSYIHEGSEGTVYGNSKPAAISGISNTQNDAMVFVNNKESKIYDSKTNIEGMIYQNHQKSTGFYIKGGSEETVFGNSKPAAISGISNTQGDAMVFVNNKESRISDSTTNIEGMVYQNHQKSTGFYIQGGSKGTVYGNKPAAISGISNTQSDAMVFVNNKESKIYDSKTNIEGMIYQNHQKSTGFYIHGESEGEVYGNSKPAAISAISNTQSDAMVFVNNKESKSSDSTTNIEGMVYQNHQKSTGFYIQGGSEGTVYGNSKPAEISGISNTQSDAMVFVNNKESKIADSTTNIEGMVYQKQNHQKSTDFYIQGGSEGTVYGNSKPAAISDISNTQSDAMVFVNNKESKIADSTTNIEGMVYQKQNHQKSTDFYIQGGSEGTVIGNSKPAAISGLSNTESDAMVFVNNKEQEISGSTESETVVYLNNKLKISDCTTEVICTTESLCKEELVNDLLIDL